MRIGIDVRYLSHGLVGGVHAYVKNFVPEVVRLAHPHEVFLYADAKREFELIDLPDNVRVRILPWRNALSSVQHDFSLRKQMGQDKLDVVHFPANYGLAPAGTKCLVTLHDEINILPLSEVIGREFLRGNIRNPRTAFMRIYLHGWSVAAIRRADLVLTVSEHARREIARHSGLDQSMIKAIPHGLAGDLGPISDIGTLAAVRAKYGLLEHFVLADGLKNPAVLVRAWRLLPADVRAARRIVFFSRRPDVLPVIHEAVAAGDAQLIVNPDRRDLVALFNLSDAFVFPSWIEGFGIPILEAMMCGAPVIASDRGSIPEVAGDAALLADAEDEHLFAAHLRSVLTQPAVASDLRARGFSRARQFSWTNTARQILDSYLAVARGERDSSRAA